MNDDDQAVRFDIDNTMLLLRRARELVERGDQTSDDGLSHDLLIEAMVDIEAAMVLLTGRGLR